MLKGYWKQMRILVFILKPWMESGLIAMCGAVWMFPLVNMLIAMPIFFLSGAFYPVNALSALASLIAYLNPLVYGVDLSRTALTGTGFLPLTSALTALVVSSLFLLVVAVWGFKKATAE
jgi:ABC-2 type transport system permease protein